MAKVGAVVRRNEDYGVVVATDPSDLGAIQVEWADGSTEWVTVLDIEWVESRE